MGVDVKGAGGTRVVKVTKDYAANENVPGVLMPYEATWLTMANSKATIFIEKNGVPQITSHVSGAGIDIYPGTTVENGDIKTAAGLAENDRLTITYGPVRYGTV